MSGGPGCCWLVGTSLTIGCKKEKKGSVKGGKKNKPHKENVDIRHKGRLLDSLSGLTEERRGKL